MPRETAVLSTPRCPGTHWYQIRFLLEVPLAVNAGQHVEGTSKMEANNLQSYYMRIDARIKGTNISASAPCIDLKVFTIDALRLLLDQLRDLLTIRLPFLAKVSFQILLTHPAANDEDEDPEYRFYTSSNSYCPPAELGGLR
ncbi:unnamed protein product [Effrenium voratum]|uniref:Uncharacterized protein n=1 Tax=Effrenium voratum TaxID=2562239 RepID=A0AA36ICJ8_9DINO|nr:unnamed protein product [Effrenium voratum]